MIYRLRSSEEIILSGKPVPVDPEDAGDVTDLLQSEYLNECLEYPGTPPPFDGAAALWAARTVYVAAQLMLYRSDTPVDIPGMLPAFPDSMTAGAILSADLCLRMLPDIQRHLSAIDPDDALIHVLGQHLQVWHYSAVGYRAEGAAPDFSLISADPCLLQMYADRVTERRDRALAANPALMPVIRANTGDLTAYFWNG